MRCTDAVVVAARCVADVEMLRVVVIEALVGPRAVVGSASGVEYVVVEGMGAVVSTAVVGRGRVVLGRDVDKNTVRAMAVVLGAVGARAVVDVGTAGGANEVLVGGRAVAVVASVTVGCVAGREVVVIIFRGWVMVASPTARRCTLACSLFASVLWA